MAKNSDDIKNFELILMRDASDKQLNLYSGDTHRISRGNKSKQPLDVDKVITCVSRQIKAIQSADCIKKSKSVSINLNKYKKSSFVPVNLLHGGIMESMPQNTNTNKFETQCVSDTQLINIVQDAEDLVSHRGMTQEFDTTFKTQEFDNTSSVQKVTDDYADGGLNEEYEDAGVESKENNTTAHENKPMFPIIDISLKEPDRTEVDLFAEDEEDNDVQIVETKNFVESLVPDKILMLADNNEHKHSDDIDFPASPVFDVKSVKKSTSPPPLVFDLETFEEFEKIALPIVEESPDKEAAKFLINSQILDKELVIQPESEPVFYKDEYQVSPVIEWSDDKLKFDEVVNLPETDQKFVSANRSRQSSILKDEILFSSDEENECGLQQYCVEDLPFTCALATSFYEQPDVLDKTMYVGFQTASNKSIQICTESFYKAKSILDDFDKDKEKPSLTELVDMCDGKNSTAIEDNIKNNDCFLITNKMDNIDSKNTISRDTVDSLKCEETITSNNKPVIKLPTLKDLSEKFIQISQPFEGFRTASNKKIRLSEIALQQSKEIFKDIDFGETENRKSGIIKSPHSIVTNDNSPSKRSEDSVLQQEIARNKKELNLDDSILLEFENDDMSHENMDKRKGKNLVRFRTASNKNIQISDDAIEKSKRVFQDIDNTDNINDANVNTNLLNSFNPSNVGFKTASNKEIKISDQAFAKTRNIFQDIELNDNTDTKQTETHSNIDSGKDIWNEPSTSKTPFVGFKTANNKEIKICDVALAKTKKIFEDIDKKNISNQINDDFIKPKQKAPDTERNKRRFDDIDEDMSHNLEGILKTSNFLEFQTASHKRIKISDEALLKSRKIFDSVDKGDSSENIIEKNNSNTEFKGFQAINKEPVTIFKDAADKSKTVSENFDDNFNIKDSLKYNQIPAIFKGFQTASNKPINVSEHALMKSKKIFEFIDKDIHAKEMKESTSFISSQTANNRTVPVSEDALFKNKNVFENITVKDQDDIEEPPFRGFQTANNKVVEISAQALTKSIQIFEDIDKDKESFDAKKVTTFIGFQTASNKEIKISKQALASSKKIFENIDTEKESIDAKTETTFIGFQTASNKKVNVSAQSLARSKKIFENIDVENKITEVEKSVFQGFQTGSNIKVNISEDALVRSKKIFENIDDKTQSNENFKSIFQGFQTASNKQVNISEKALARSRKIFENIDIEDNSYDVPETNSFQGFQTGNNKKVNVSEQALARSRIILEHIDIVKDDLKKPKGSSFIGFQTASNREVKISKEALAKTKYIFQDIDIIPETTENDPNIAMSQVIPIKGTNNSVTNTFKDSFREPESNFADSVTDGLSKQTRNDPKHLVDNKAASLVKDTVNIESVIDTQVMKDFNESLNTEDFSKAITPAKSKRSGSPILSCPKAKRRKKFETPYNKTQKTIITPAIEEEINKTDDNKQQAHIFESNYKKIKKYNLINIQNMEKQSPDSQSSVDPCILEHTFEKLLQFEFFGKRNELSNERWTTEDLKKYFLNAVNKNFVPDGWLDNHLKLIIWKLISYEIKFPKTMGVVCTSRNVIDQLKYRYDKELFNSERPFLRKVMEKDDVSTKLMVLCVVAVLEDGVAVDRVANKQNLELLLTDGWYCIRASLDRMLCDLVANGKITVGAKIATCGAELVGCDQGVAPWEDTSQIRLKLSGNSTRRARWPARLGCYGNGRHGNGAILCRLRDVTPAGGRAARLRVMVTRVYPALYVEKFDDGSTVTRSERLELLHQMKYENERQTLLEKLYEEVQKDFSDEDSQDSEVDPELKRQCLDSGSQIAKAMKKSKDPSEFRSYLTDTQIDLLADDTTKKRDRLIQDIQARVEERIAESGLNVTRNVVPVLKIRIAGVTERGDDVEVTRGLMSIWKPNDAITEIVKEGSWIEVMNVIPTAIRYSEIQISAGRQSIFTQAKYKESEKIKPYTKSMKRTCYSIKDLARNPAMTTEYNEVDTVGIVVLIEPSAKEFDSNKNQFQNVYLADADKNMVCVNFWGGIKKLGYENILDTGQVVACLNLQKRAGNTRKSIPQYRVTEFSYFTKTPKNDEARSITDDLEKKLLGVDRIKFCDDCVVLKNNYSVYKMQNYNENVSPYRYQNVDMNLSKNRVFIDSPMIAKSVKNDENLNLSGLDFESTFKQVDTQEYSPRTMLRKRQIKEKLEKLKMYGEPPALSPMQILNRSKNAGSAFKSPLPKSDTPTSVANAGEILLKEKKVASNDIEGSPVIMDRTFVKRINVNPVKLDFNSAVDDSNLSDKIDHFAEEFDGSPPLSLD